MYPSNSTVFFEAIKSSKAGKSLEAEGTTNGKRLSAKAIRYMVLVKPYQLLTTYINNI